MHKGRITVAPNEARDRLVLSVALEGMTPASAVLEAPKVAELIEKIAHAHAAIHDRAVAEEAAMTVLEFTTVNPDWRGSADISLAGEAADSVALGLQHSTYGWLTFILPDPEARRLGRWLLETAKDA